MPLAAVLTIALLACNQTTEVAPDTGSAGQALATPPAARVVTLLSGEGITLRPDFVQATAGARSFTVPTSNPELTLIVHVKDGGDAGSSVLVVRQPTPDKMDVADVGLALTVHATSQNGAWTVTSSEPMGAPNIVAALFQPKLQPKPLLLQPFAPAPPQCTVQVPGDLVMNRNTAQNGVNTYGQVISQDDVAITSTGALAFAARASGAIPLSGVLTLALLVAQQKRQVEANTLQNANLRLTNYQSQIDAWKANYASSHRCIWY